MEQLAWPEKILFLVALWCAPYSCTDELCRSRHIKLTGAFLVNWHLVSAAAAATEFLGDQGQLLETSYAQLI